MVAVRLQSGCTYGVAGHIKATIVMRTRRTDDTFNSVRIRALHSLLSRRPLRWMGERTQAPDHARETATEKAPSHQVTERAAPSRPRKWGLPTSGHTFQAQTWKEVRPRFAGSGPRLGQHSRRGISIGDVRRELALDGIQISYSKLRTYVARLRRAHPQDLDSGPGRGVVAPNPRQSKLRQARGRPFRLHQALRRWCTIR